jgi:hypothetical protein
MLAPFSPNTNITLDEQRSVLVLKYITILFIEKRYFKSVKLRLRTLWVKACFVCSHIAGSSAMRVWAMHCWLHTLPITDLGNIPFPNPRVIWPSSVTRIPHLSNCCSNNMTQPSEWLHYRCMTWSSVHEVQKVAGWLAEWLTLLNCYNSCFNDSSFLWLTVWLIGWLLESIIYRQIYLMTCYLIGSVAKWMISWITYWFIGSLLTYSSIGWFADSDVVWLPLFDWLTNHSIGWFTASLSVRWMLNWMSIYSCVTILRECLTDPLINPLFKCLLQWLINRQIIDRILGY